MTELRAVESSPRKYVYAIGQLSSSDDNYEYIKIGVSANPLARMDSLQTGNPRKLWIAGWIDANPQAEEIERGLHLILDRERVEGEWFAVTERTEFVLKLIGLLTYDRWHDGESRDWPNWVVEYRKRHGWQKNFEAAADA